MDKLENYSQKIDELEKEKLSTSKEIYSLYQSKLKANNAIDFDDIINLYATLGTNSRLEVHNSIDSRHYRTNYP